MEHLRSTNVVFAIVMALLVVQSSTRPQPDELEEIKKTLYNACAGKFPITEEMKKDILNSNMVDDQNFKCFLRCCFDEMSMIDEDGIIDGESLISMATDNLKPVIQQVVQSCVKDIKQDGCEAAFNFISCGLKLNPMTIQLLPL
ncbi:pheromone-binding protein-related protein 6-like [Myzus persicae]|uniref:Odorant-binding protein n=1 Tax=Myzus persicae TaxID=13164 RepID=B6E9U6_MYZPE|nr:pheromone-binding protein-related protein 6-like [Myzus persicae]ACI30684.1 odorant-binding protein [Myzus persicae]AWV63289.1 odorant-binding protein 10 [Myzus persicae]